MKQEVQSLQTSLTQMSEAKTQVEQALEASKTKSDILSDEVKRLTSSLDKEQAKSQRYEDEIE